MLYVNTWPKLLFPPTLRLNIGTKVELTIQLNTNWKATAIAINDAPLQPEPGRFIDIPGDGHGKIISVTKRGKLFHLHVLLDTGKPKNLLFKPDKMVVWEQ